MPSVLLLHTNQEYANTLATAAEAVDPAYEVEVVAREPLSTRLRHLTSTEYDLVQADELMVNGPLVAGTSLLTGTPYVVAIRGWADYTNAHDQYSLPRDLSIQLRSRAVLKRARSVVFLSEWTRDEFEQQYPVSRGAVTGRPIDVEYYRSGTKLEEAPFDTDHTTILTVTNLRYEEKFRGVRTILEGLQDAFDQYPKLRYAIAGDGAYSTELQEFLRDYPYEDRVFPLGYRDDVPDILANADIFVYVSFLDALPTVVLEAQAAGLPVIGGDAVGVPEAMGDAGVVCPPHPEGVSEAIVEVLEDDAYRETLAQMSEDRMKAHNEQSAKKHLAEWNRILDYS